MTISKKMLLLVLTAAFGLVLVASIGVYQTQRVFKVANFTNVNLMPSVIALDAASDDLAKFVCGLPNEAIRQAMRYRSAMRLSNRRLNRDLPGAYPYQK